MASFSEFLVNNYIWFLVATLVLLFALIGYIVDSKNKLKQSDEPNVEKEEKKKKTKEEETIESIKDIGPKTLSDVVKNNKNTEISEVETPQEEVTYDQPLIIEEDKKDNVFNDENKTN